MPTAELDNTNLVTQIKNAKKNQQSRQVQPSQGVSGCGSRDRQVKQLKDVKIANPSAFSNKMSESGVVQQQPPPPGVVLQQELPVGRRDSDTAFILVNGKLETINSQRN